MPLKSCPTITTTDVYREARQSTIGDIPAPDDDRPVTAGGDDHVTLVNFLIQFYRERGHEAYKPDGDSVTDIKLIPDDDTPTEAATDDQGPINVEVEDENISKPANTLVNYARARHQSNPVRFITHTRPDARQLRNRLRKPWNDTVDVTDGVVLYTGPKITLDEDTDDNGAEHRATAVLTDTVTPAHWVLTHDHRLQLRPKNDPDTALIDIRPDETVSKDDLNAGIKCVSTDYTPTDDEARVHQPHVPVDMHCLTNATIQYRIGNTFQTYDPKPDWAFEDDNQDRYTAAIEEFLREFTVEHEGATIDYEEFQTAVQRFMSAYVTDDAIPNATWIGRSLPGPLDIDGPGQPNRQLHDRTWIIPPNTVSPYLPFIDNDTSDTDTETNAT